MVAGVPRVLHPQRVQDGRVSKVFVKVIQREGGKVLVDGDLKKGDVIVIKGVQGLRPGSKVKATPRSGEANEKAES